VETNREAIESHSGSARTAVLDWSTRTFANFTQTLKKAKLKAFLRSKQSSRIRFLLFLLRIRFIHLNIRDSSFRQLTAALLREQRKSHG